MAWPQRSSIVAAVVAGLLLGVRETAAQDTRPDAYTQAADRLTSALPRSEDVRLAIVAIAEGPVADGPRPDPIPIASDVTAQVRRAFAESIERDGRSIALVDPANIDRAALRLGVVQPLGPLGATLVGVSVDADYVVAGSVLRDAKTDAARLDLTVLDVRTRESRARVSTDLPAPDRTPSTALASTAPSSPTSAAPIEPAPRASAPPVESVSATVERATPAAAAPATRTSATAESQGPAPDPIGQPFVLANAGNGPSARPLIASVGFAGAAAAAVFAWREDSELKQSRERLLALPPGASDEWATELDHAEQVERRRNLWWGAAIGAGAGTLAYLLASAVGDDDGRSERAMTLPLPGRWTVRPNLAMAGVVIAGSF